MSCYLKPHITSLTCRSDADHAKKAMFPARVSDWSNRFFISSQWCKWRKRAVFSEAIMCRDKRLRLRWKTSWFPFFGQLVHPWLSWRFRPFWRSFWNINVHFSKCHTCKFQLGLDSLCCPSENLAAVMCLLKWWWSVRYFLPAHAAHDTLQRVLSAFSTEWMNQTNTC